MNNDINIGLGFRREIADEFLTGSTVNPDFIEVAPENWIDMGGYWYAKFREATEKYPLILHGLSLSIGSPEEPDWAFLKKLKSFLKEFNVEIYSEHLSFAKLDNAHLYDLLPIPFKEDSIKHVVKRIKQVQDFLEMKIAIENVSYYTSVDAEIAEDVFVKQIVEQADCNLLLDVNNVYVNSFNHKYDAEKYIDAMPLDKVRYIHMAGHHKISDELIIDTHGEAIIHPVYELFDYTLSKMDRNVPVLLERDFNFPEMEELQSEMKNLRNICIKNQKQNVILS
ncbi:MAG: DUF692 domain-containing protein [Chlorobi bacterium]|nr:DUF692 domain-containing protein [Chlorobiota bacterium]